MKKVIILLSLIAVIFACNPSQSQTILNMPKGNTWIKTTDDITLTNNVAKYIQINAPQDWYTAQAYTIQLDSVSGNHTNVAVVLSGRVSDQTSTWTTISTINWTGSSDTTIIGLNATENAYRQFRVTLTGTGTGVSKVDTFEFKQWFGLP